jgi:hypothetical protein
LRRDLWPEQCTGFDQAAEEIEGDGMAIKWTVSHHDRLITAIGEIPVTATEIMQCADEVAKAGLGTYRKMFDLTRLTGALSQADTRMVGARMMQHAYGHAFAPIAMVVSNEVAAESAKIFQAVSGADRQVQIFRDPYVARVWLDVMAPANQISQAAAE